MSARHAEHPAAVELSDFVLGNLDPADIDRIEHHLHDCPPCCDTLRQLHSDTFIDLVQTGARARSPHGETVTLPAGPTGGPVELPAGLTDHPRYRVQELIGRGGMGAVYRAEHRLMRRTVALKIINPRLVASESAVDRFRREIQAAASLQHPNIVTAHDAEQAGDVHFFVMEYVAGTDLQELLNRRGALPVAEACEYARQAAVGLQHAHEKGMVHRDIKPHNLMVVTSPGGTAQVKILDFGLASLAGTEPAVAAQPGESDTLVTSAGSVMGTPDYMAPEQGRDAHAADIRADIYSLGCTLYTLLTGRVPFPDGSALDKIQAHAERRPPAVTELRPEAPAALAKVLDRMMDPDRARRYQTPAEVAAALAAVAAPAKPAARRRLAVALALAVAAAILLGIVYVTTDRGQLVIDSNVDDVQVVVTRGGKEVEVIDLKTGTTVKRLPAGEYAVHLKGERTDVKLDAGGFRITRGGEQIVSVKEVVKPKPVVRGEKPRRRPAPTDPIAPAHQKAIDKGLAYLVKSQSKDGYWEAEKGLYRVAMTALAGMALLMDGNTVEDGPYAESVRRAVEWLLSGARADGLLGDPAEMPRDERDKLGHAAAVIPQDTRYMFGHGYAMLFLSSVYSLDEDAERRARLQKVLGRAVEFTAGAVTFRGGWGYVAAREGGNFDESATTIVQLHGLRAARNAGVAVPRKMLDAEHLRKCTTRDGGIIYSITSAGGAGRPALTAAALSVGEFDSDLAKRWLAFCQKAMPLTDRGQVGHDLFANYYYAQAVYVLGETGYQKLIPDTPAADRLTWSKYRKLMFDELVSRQAADGSWAGDDYTAKSVGPVYVTASMLTVLQLDHACVPIYRR